jgi:CheY-like chemotaxis protein
MSPLEQEPLRILFADDNPTHHRNMVRTLAAQGHEMRQAYSFEEARGELERIRRQKGRFDVIVSDLDMGAFGNKLAGIRLLNLCARKGMRPGLFVLRSTAFNKGNKTERARRLLLQPVIALARSKGAKVIGKNEPLKLGEWLK